MQSTQTSTKEFLRICFAEYDAVRIHQKDHPKSNLYYKPLGVKKVAVLQEVLRAFARVVLLSNHVGNSLSEIIDNTERQCFNHEVNSGTKIPTNVETFLYVLRDVFVQHDNIIARKMLLNILAALPASCDMEISFGKNSFDQGFSNAFLQHKDELQKLVHAINDLRSLSLFSFKKPRLAVKASGPMRT